MITDIEIAKDRVAEEAKRGSWTEAVTAVSWECHTDLLDELYWWAFD